MTTTLPSPARSDASLVQAARSGDHQAFGELVCRYSQGVIHVVYRMCGDPDLAEEAAQEAFIRAWQYLPTYKPALSFRSWVYRIALNAALDDLRRQRPQTDVEDVELPAQQGNPEQIVEQQQRSAQVQRALQALPSESRAALVLREYEGLSYREIAEVLNIPLGTVMSRLNYARTQLRQALAPYLEVL